jgi:hypothetical protein
LSTSSTPPWLPERARVRPPDVCPPEESPRWVVVFGGTYSTWTVRRLLSFCCLRYAASASASTVPCLLTRPPIVGVTADFFEDSRTEELRAIIGLPSSSSAGTVVFWISPGVVVLDVINSTTWAYSLSQLWRATSKRSALFLGLGTRILRRRSRAWGLTYSGNVRGVLTIYLYRRLMLSPSGFAGSSSNGR